MKELYEMIYKRKSIRKYDDTLTISDDEMKQIQNKLNHLKPLIDTINVRFEIVKREETTSKRGTHCLLMYSEKKEMYLYNAGYMLEQMDLFLASLDIGVCWYGMAKVKEEPHNNDLDYVIMLAFGKSRPQDFRMNLTDTKRKDVEAIWENQYFLEAAHLARYAPSACNTQSWRVKSSPTGLKIFRFKKIISFIPPKKVPYFNSIDLGIFLCYLDIILEKQGYHFVKELCFDSMETDKLIAVAEYRIES